MIFRQNLFVVHGNTPKHRSSRCHASTTLAGFPAPGEKLLILATIFGVKKTGTSAKLSVGLIL
jgi:hypothetical protein